ncbi:PQQ-dependent dehydrogenase, methanol/ethanol family [Sphingobium nicotianae]|uniref:PQQ-dependent dehydrogenase, methanol/ethanol family n=1 Tax=Sphingobium nicotianae TaxID=2782607 RepID=UPI0032D92942
MIQSFRARALQSPILVAVAMVTALGACTSKSDGPTATPDSVDNAMLANETDGGNWASYGRTFNENHFSPLTQISDGNVAQLGLAWSLDIDTPLRADSQPLAVNGVIYIATGLSVVQAVKADTGKVLWRYDPKLVETIGTRKALPSWGIRGLAIWKDKVIVGLQDGRLVGINRASGKLAWSVQTLDAKSDKLGEVTITGAPRVFHGKVIIGFAGAERWARGAVSAFDADTGKFLWRFFTVPGNPADGFEDETQEKIAKTWSGEWWKYGGGGTVWNAMTYDPAFNRIYIGTGNGGPWNWKVRNPKGGDALFLASIVALDADTGKYVWHYQENPNEAWDYNSTMDIELATLSIDGKPRKVLMHAPKNGFFYLVDRASGKLISAEKIGKVTWASGIDLKTGRPIDVPGNRYENGPIAQWPGTYGTHNWQPMSFSPQTSLAYIPTIHQADIYSAKGLAPKDWKRTPDSWNTGMSGDVGGLSIDANKFSSTLQAWDPVKQQAKWKVSTPGVVNGGTMATAGKLVFQGHVDGSFNAYQADNGKKLWRFEAGVSVLGAPISFLANGVQYVAVLAAPPSGSPGATLTVQAKYGWKYRESPKRLLVFKLGGTAKLPAGAAPERAEPLKDTTFKVDEKAALTGGVEFTNYCMGCHGAGAVAAGGAPDLRASPVVLDAESFKTVVHGGMLKPNGMPGFDTLSDQQLLQIRNYIRQQAAAKQDSKHRGSGP